MELLRTAALAVAERDAVQTRECDGCRYLFNSNERILQLWATNITSVLMFLQNPGLHSMTNIKDSPTSI